MRKDAEKELTKLNKNPKNIFRLVKFMQKDGKDRRLNFSKKERIRIWKNYIEEIMNKENDRDYVTEGSMVEGPIKNVTREEIAIAIKVMKS